MNICRTAVCYYRVRIVINLYATWINVENVSSCVRKGIFCRYFLQNVNRLTPELNPSAQRCLTRFCTGDFVSWTVHIVDICVKKQQIHQLFIQFINYTGQQNLTFFFVPRGKISNPDSTFNAEFKYVSSFSPSPTVFLWQSS
jgi:hypothetical protein